MADNRIAFSHSSISGTTLRKPLTPIIPSPHPHSEGAVIYGWPLTTEQEPERISAADRIGISTPTQVEAWDEAGNVLTEPLTGNHLAPMCRIESDYLLSAESAEVFSRFDLGKSTFKRVPVVKQSGEEIPGDWYFLHIGERKETLVPLKADKFRSPSAKSTTILGPLWIKENQLPAEAGAAKGVAIWRDPIWRNGVFMSAPLASSLEAAGLADPWGLARCRWVTDEERVNRMMTHDNSLSTPEYKMSAI
jgi:hypothetical protein